MRLIVDACMLGRVLFKSNLVYTVMGAGRIIELFRGQLWECQLLESMLKGSDIDCFLRNSKRAAYGSIVTPAQMVQIMIKEEDLEVAERILTAFKESLS